jgi:poly(hydroxyalkanoate) granule-associated protein
MAEVEVVVVEVEEEEDARVKSLREVYHKAFLAGVGAMTLAQETASDYMCRFIERGERVEMKSRELLRERMAQRKYQVRKVTRRTKEKTAEAEDELQVQVGTLLDRMNVPTKNDIDALSSKIVSLTEKVDELKRARESGD